MQTLRAGTLNQTTYLCVRFYSLEGGGKFHKHASFTIYLLKHDSDVNDKQGGYLPWISDCWLFAAPDLRCCLNLPFRSLFPYHTHLYVYISIYDGVPCEFHLMKSYWLLDIYSNLKKAFKPTATDYVCN